ANRELFEEQVELILKAFGQESFAHHGKHYTVPPDVPYRGYQLKEITLVPRPRRRPVEIWQPIVSGSARGLDFMAHVEGREAGDHRGRGPRLSSTPTGRRRRSPRPARR